MSRRITALLAVLACMQGAAFAISPRRPARATSPPSARRLLEDALAAMGGTGRWRALETLRVEGNAVRSLVGTSADPAWPDLLISRFSELRDLRNRMSVRHATFALSSRPSPIMSTQVMRQPDATAMERETLDLTPERLVLDALDAADSGAVRLLGDTVFGGRPAHVVTLTGNGVRLFLDAVTRLPLGWSATRAYEPGTSEWAMWGDVRTSSVWKDWMLTSGGFRYPLAQVLERNGVVVRRTMLTRVTINPPTAPDSFPASARRRPRPIALGNGLGTAPSELVPGVVWIPGQYNVTLVRQDDGIVVLEAPHSDAYSRAVLDEVKRRFPGVPVRAVIVSSAVWPHDAGIRAYVARGARVYGPPRGVALVRALAAAPHTLRPDELARVPRAVLATVVEKAKALGTGPNRIELRVVAVAAGERAASTLVAYLPGRHLLYAGDLLIPQRFEPNFWRQSWNEIHSIVREEKWSVAQVLAMHDAPMPWSGVLRSLADSVP